MNNLRTALFAAAGLVGSSGIASSNAFLVNEHDARVTGRGGAVAASDDDASSIVFNPGGVALSEGTQIILGASLYIAQGSYENDTTPEVKTDSPAQTAPNLYITSRVHDMVAVGLGFHFPYGLKVSYPENHPQAAVTQDSDLKTLFISPVIGLNLNKQVPGLSLGGGVDVVPASIELKRAIQFGQDPAGQGTVDLAADTVGVGFRAGVQYHPPMVKGLKVGAMYRSQVKLDFEGQADFDIAEPYRSQLPPDGDVSSSITLPQAVSGGVAYSPAPNLEVEVDATWVNWKKTFPSDANRGGGATSLSITLPDGTTSDAPEDYKNTLTWRFGLDYLVEKPKIGLRAGFIYDPTPIPTTTQTALLPDVDRINLTLGAGKQISDTLAADLSLLWVTPRSRDSSNDPADPIFHGTYSVQALVMSFGLRGTFGGAKAAPLGEPTVAKK